MTTKMRLCTCTSSLVLALWLLGKPALSQQTDPTEARVEQIPMETVTGIGGLFFRARNPETLGRWYLTHLGITLTPANYEELPWRQEAGPTVFAPFPETTDYFGAPQQAWMVNFRVRDLAAMTAQLQAAGIAVTVDPKEYPNGRFARLHDPEGNPIELWQPRERDAAR